MTRKELIIVLITFCLAATLFSIIPVGSQAVQEEEILAHVTRTNPRAFFPCWCEGWDSNPAVSGDVSRATPLFFFLRDRTFFCNAMHRSL